MVWGRTKTKNGGRGNEKIQQSGDIQKNVEIGQKLQPEEVKELKQQTAEVQQTLTVIQSTIIQRDEDWRNALNKSFNNVVENSESRDYEKARKYTYELLEERAQCNLATRLRNLKQRLYDRGESKTAIAKANKLDVIESEPRLKEIYSSIVKELAVKYTVYKRHGELAGNLADGSWKKQTAQRVTTEAVRTEPKQRTLPPL